MLIPIDELPVEDDEQEEYLTRETLALLKPAFEQMDEEILLKVYIDESRDSREMEGFLGEVAQLGNKIRMHFYHREEAHPAINYPFVYVCRKDGRKTGAVYSQIPQGRKFQQFVEDLYQASSSARPLDSYVDLQMIWS